MASGIVESHFFLGLVVGSDHEWDDGELTEPWGHGQDLASVGVFVDVLIVSRVLHASWVPTNNVVGGSSCDAGLEEG